MKTLWTVLSIWKSFFAISNLDTDLPRLAQLAEIKGLRALSLRTENILALPADLLIHTPHLTTLRLAGNKISSISEGFLSPTPQLTRLTLNSRVLPVFAQDFLAPVARLEQLSVSIRESLPASLLVRTPHLTKLDVFTDEELSPQFFASTPLLESLSSMHKRGIPSRPRFSVRYPTLPS